MVFDLALQLVGILGAERNALNSFLTSVDRLASLGDSILFSDVVLLWPPVPPEKVLVNAVLN